LSAISRAVANSGPRPITNIRPTDANGMAIEAAARSSSGRWRSRSAAVCSSSRAISSPRPASSAASSASAASWFEYVFVAATACSSPAASGSTACAAFASEDPGSFVTAIVKAPSRRARVTYSSTSGVRPDWESATTVEWARSILAR
jgi:hypothetical protein